MSNEIEKNLDALLKEKGMRFGQVQTLLHIYEMTGDGVVFQDVLTDKMSIDKSNVSRNLAKLESMGYITITSSEENNRKKEIEMTAFAHSQMKDYFDILVRVTDQMMSGLPQTWIETTEACLTQVMKNLSVKS
ncbi:MAG: MarR family transcriptional regulator, transcriptional regulator for hemolysin [Clostridiales bacterium]|nr:MarR family transcriptional regulator, transcriptional regulator for hemolysin [Clostridiales bacterium]